MFAVISPAKKLNFDALDSKVKHSMPRMLQDTEELMESTRVLKPKDLSGLMKISDNLAELDYARFQAFSTPFTKDNAKQAVLAFNGDTYPGLDECNRSRFCTKTPRHTLGALWALKAFGLDAALSPRDGNKIG